MNSNVKAVFAALLIAATGAFIPLLAISGTALAASGTCSPNLQFLTLSGNAATGGPMDYLLTAKNLGTAPCNDASISLYYATNEHFGSASPAPTADGYYWRLGNLAPGAILDIVVGTTRSAPLLAGDAVNEACLASDNGADACADAAVAAPQAAQAAQTVQQPTPQAPSVAVTLTQAGDDQSQAQVQTQPGSSQSLAQPPVTLPAGTEYGVWEWTSAYGMSQATAQQIVNNASANGFNVIYMTVDTSLNLSGTQLANYEASLNTLITLAAAKNIAVDAEAGTSDWALPANWSSPEAIITFVANYNQTHAIKFRGVQFDIEPYSLSQYAQNPSAILTDYVQMVEALVNVDKNYGMPLGMDIPFFYTQQAGAPEITVDGITTYPANHLVRLLNELPYGRLLIMAYRNFATGSNGTIDISSPEIQLANTGKVNVIVGQETGNVQPNYVTFYGMTKAQMAAQGTIVKQSFASDKSFGGIAVDYLEPYMQLK
jgi:hypothetical protein